MTPDEGRGRLVREMGLAHADFWRLLPQAVGDCPWRADGTRVGIEVDGGRVEIELGPEGERRIAGLTLPSTTVRFRWEGVARPAFDAFLERFDRYYRRGGG